MEQRNIWSHKNIRSTDTGRNLVTPSRNSNSTTPRRCWRIPLEMIRRITLACWCRRYVKEKCILKLPGIQFATITTNQSNKHTLPSWNTTTQQQHQKRRRQTYSQIISKMKYTKKHPIHCCSTIESRNKQRCSGNVRTQHRTTTHVWRTTQNPSYSI